MAIHHLTLLEVERAIKQLEPEKQRKLLVKLPQLLNIKAEDLELLKLAEPSFKFWVNEKDSVYDTL